jgi:RimJ/RimL family protein N-acetyltransferase
LETPRLLLRPHRLDDFAAAFAMWADPAVTRYIGGRPFTAEETWSRLLRYAGHWQLLGYGYWVIERKTTRTFTGEIGFADYHRDLKPSLDGTPEIGWALIPSAHGQGFATEAVRAVVAWGDAHFGAIRTACIISPENKASIRVAEKCGYRGNGSATYKDAPTLVFVRDPIA